MAQGRQVNRVELHHYLWTRATKSGRVEIYQKDLAEELKITPATMSLTLKALKEEGRIRKISSRKGNIGIYSIRDPANF